MRKNEAKLRWKNYKRVSLLEHNLGILSRNNNEKLLSKLAEQGIHYLSFKVRTLSELAARSCFLTKPQLPPLSLSLSLSLSLCVLISSLFLWNPTPPVSLCLFPSSSSHPSSRLLYPSLLIVPFLPLLASSLPSLTLSLAIPLPHCLPLCITILSPSLSPPASHLSLAERLRQGRWMLDRCYAEVSPWVA